MCQTARLLWHPRTHDRHWSNVFSMLRYTFQSIESLDTFWTHVITFQALCLHSHYTLMRGWNFHVGIGMCVYFMYLHNDFHCLFIRIICCYVLISYCPTILISCCIHVTWLNDKKRGQAQYLIHFPMIFQWKELVWGECLM